MRPKISTLLMAMREPFIFLTPTPRIRPWPRSTPQGFLEPTDWLLTAAVTSGQVTEPQAKDGSGRSPAPEPTARPPHLSIVWRYSASSRCRMKLILDASGMGGVGTRHPRLAAWDNHRDTNDSQCRQHIGSSQPLVANGLAFNKKGDLFNIDTARGALMEDGIRPVWKPQKSDRVRYHIHAPTRSA